MDSCFDSKQLIDDWAIPYFNKIVKEIKENEGKVSNIKRNSVFIEVISQIKNLVRYDQISKDSVITYSLPSNMEFEFKF
jgi:ribosomal protein S1